MFAYFHSPTETVLVVSWVNIRHNENVVIKFNVKKAIENYILEILLLTTTKKVLL